MATRLCEHQQNNKASCVSPAFIPTPAVHCLAYMLLPMYNPVPSIAIRGPIPPARERAARVRRPPTSRHTPSAGLWLHGTWKAHINVMLKYYSLFMHTCICIRKRAPSRTALILDPSRLHLGESWGNAASGRHRCPDV